MGQRGRGHRLAETVASRRLRGFAEKVGRGADDRLDRPAKEDEQRLREVVCERRGVGVRCDDSPHDEAARPCLRTFHTASPRTWVNSPAPRPVRALALRFPTARGIALQACRDALCQLARTALLPWARCSA